jgi:hypothetical protein
MSTPENPCADFLYATDEPDSRAAEPGDPPPTVTPAATPRLTDYDIILVNSSAGKNSQATLDVVAGAARDAGVLDRLVVVDADRATPNGTVYPNSAQSTPHTTACDSRSPGVNTTEHLRPSSIAYR